MKKGIKNWLLSSFLLLFINVNAQNLVKNPSFEEFTASFELVGWNPLFGDTAITHCTYFNVLYPYNYPNDPNFTGFQYSHSGTAYVGESIYCSDIALIDGDHQFLNSKLKDTLILGQSYCAGLWWVSWSTTRWATDDLSIFINHGEIDTVDTCDAPIPWVIAQVNNPVGSIMNDTTNWNLLQNSFIATGGENTITIGSFKPNTQVTAFNRGAGYNWQYTSAYLYDDVFVYPLYFPAFAGNDTIIFPGDTITLGSVGEQLVCTWFDTTGAVIGQGSSIKVAPMVPTKYIIMQDLCNIQKFDTVLVIADSVLAGYDHIQQRNDFKMYPNPAKDEVTIDCDFASKVVLRDILGVEVSSIHLQGKHSETILLNGLPSGVYTVELTNLQNFEKVCRKLVVE